MTHPRLVGINHVALEVDDLERTLAFYGRLFEFKLRGRSRDAAFIDIGDQFIALMQGRSQPPDGARHFGLVVDDKEATRRVLEAAHAETLRGRGLDFRDPSGNHVQVVQYDEIQFTKSGEVLRGWGLSWRRPRRRSPSCGQRGSPEPPDRPRLAVVADWATISSLATAGGTLVLAAATFASVRSANRAARVAERALLTGLRPLLIPSRLDDPPQKIGFADGKWVVAPGSSGVAEATDEVVYLALALRNVGSGIAVLHGWRFYPERLLSGDREPRADEFRRLSRDLYVPVADVGFWQGAFRDPAAPEFAAARTAVTARKPVTVDLLYSDQEGGQRVISRFVLTPRDDGHWIAAAARHWNLDRADPR